MKPPLKVVVIGIGRMGRLHLKSYHENPGYEVIGIVDSAISILPEEFSQYKSLLFDDFNDALALKPDVVSINTYPQSHGALAIAAMEAGAHVFVEKPLSITVEGANLVATVANTTKRKLLVGYTLRYHPTWIEFIRRAKLLEPPFVMRMTLNQRSHGDDWNIHKQIMKTTSPLVDCGVHYVDVMLQITDARPTQVRGIGARLTKDISVDQVNYGQLQITFDDGSVGWFEAGWGPMMSETAYFVKDVIGRRGFVSIVADEEKPSSYLDSHAQKSKIRLGYTENEKEDEEIVMDDEPDHSRLSALEQEYLRTCIVENRDLSQHTKSAVRSLAIVLAAELSMRENRAVDLDI